MYYKLSHKSKQFFWLLLKLAIVIGCGYFIYQKLLKNDELQFLDFLVILKQREVFSFKKISFLLIFTFLNWFLEIYKWKKLASFSKKISFKNATTQSLASLTTSLITPNRIGEYGAKVLYFKKKNRKQILGLNLIGNFYQMLITVIFGIIGFTYFVWLHNISINLYPIFRICICISIVVLAFFFGTKYFNYRIYSVQKAKEFITKIPRELTIKVILFSLFRFVVFSHQFYFLIYIFNIDISYIEALSAITSIYFIASIIPMLSLLDVVLKGTIAIWVFSYFNVDPIVILSITTLMWLFNFVLPAIVGCYFVITFTPNFVK